MAREFTHIDTLLAEESDQRTRYNTSIYQIVGNCIGSFAQLCIANCVPIGIFSSYFAGLCQNQVVNAQ